MLSDAEIIAAKTRLKNNKLDLSDVDSLVSAFRSVLGSLENTYKFKLQENLEALDDSAPNARGLAAKYAAIHLRLVNEDFGVSILESGLENDDTEQRRIFIIFALGLMWKIPGELSYSNVPGGTANNKVTSSSVRLVTVP